MSRRPTGPATAYRQRRACTSSPPHNRADVLTKDRQTDPPLRSRPSPDGLTELGRLETTAAYGSVNRSLVVGDTVYMLSDQALQAHSLETHRQVDKLLL